MSKLELKIPPLLLLALGFVLIWLVAQKTPLVDFSQFARNFVALAMSLVGAVLAVGGVISCVLGGASINPLRPALSQQLITSGVYRITRNPMYLGFVSFLLAWSFYLSSMYALLVVLGYMFYLTRLQIIPEERVLAASFGEDFDDYRSRVRRWL